VKRNRQPENVRIGASHRTSRALARRPMGKRELARFCTSLKHKQNRPQRIKRALPKAEELQRRSA